ncbi:hypothetical protein KC901_03020 [Patescibacteria group bacterium]|nr:hypothetical protein [Patescibacteria group bacterium]
MNNQNQQFGYLKYKGDNFKGSVDIGQLAKTLYALDKFSKKYQKEILQLTKEEMFSIKASDVQDGSTDVILEIVDNVVSSAPALLMASGYALDRIGVTEYTKKYFGTLGEQAALRKLARNKKLKERKREISKDNQIFVVVENSNQETTKISEETWNNYKILNPALNNLVEIEKGAHLEIGYLGEDRARNIVANISSDESQFFVPEKLDEIEGNLEDRLQEEFNEENSEEITITGKFIDFFGMAQKYHCSFQSRREQEKTGKQKILCILETDAQKDNVLELLKDRSSEHLVYVHGRATRDWEDRIDKLRVEWISKDKNYNPNQTKII